MSCKAERDAPDAAPSRAACGLGPEDMARLRQLLGQDAFARLEEFLRRKGRGRGAGRSELRKPN